MRIMMVLALAALVASFSCCVEREAGDKMGLPNPAAVYCEEMGYEYRITTDGNGSQAGECLVDGNWVDEWTLYRNASEEDADALGGDRDEHGCIGSAGYAWCEEKQKCLRTWEENCSDYTVAEIMDESCEKDSDCTTPEEYLLMSHCPYTSKCLEGKCAVICPFPFKSTIKQVSSFEECAAAGYPVMESYPRQCRTPGGRTFTEKVGGMPAYNSSGGGVGLANPASVYCEEEAGGHIRMVEGAEGQAGYCVLVDGRSCEEWAFYRSEGVECNSPEPFCGWSTNGSCQSDGDCITGGCSGQVCQSKKEEPAVTTCEFRECYRAENYGLGCKCVGGKCQWS